MQILIKHGNPSTRSQINPASRLLMWAGRLVWSELTVIWHVINAMRWEAVHACETLCEMLYETHTRTPLKSESTSESSRHSSSGTFLFFSRCSSRLFCRRTNDRKEMREEDESIWLKRSETQNSQQISQLPKLWRVRPPLSETRTEETGCKLAARTTMQTWSRLQNKRNLNTPTPPKCTLLLFLCTRTQQHNDPQALAACRACESAVGGDSLALHSCVSCWCASLMTNLSDWCVSCCSDPANGMC